MQPLKQLRIWHALIAISATAAYFAEDAEPWHQLLGYAVVALIAIRLLMALFGAAPLGLQRFYPKFQDLKLGTAATHPAISRTLLLGIALCLLGVTTTGVLMDQGKALQSLSGAAGGAPISVELRASDDDDGPRSHPRGAGEGGDEDGEEGPLGDVHELFANLLIGMVALHVSYLILFKWPLARFMLFIRQPRKEAAPKPQY
jgi:cytochrome b